MRDQRCGQPLGGAGKPYPCGPRHCGAPRGRASGAGLPALPRRSGPCRLSRFPAGAELSNEDLREDFEQQQAKVSYLRGEEKQTHSYRGPLLLDILNSAEPEFDPEVKNDKLRHVINVAATDGYAAVIAWGEIDPDFAGTRVLLAHTEDGEALERPRLVVPGDKQGGRYVRRRPAGLSGRADR